MSEDDADTPICDEFSAEMTELVTMKQFRKINFLFKMSFYLKCQKIVLFDTFIT